MNPLSISLIDVTGYLKFGLREDGADIASLDIALGKARAALAFGCTSKAISDALSSAPVGAASVVAALLGRMVLVAGGVPLRDDAGAIIGAMAAAGDAPDNDEAVVLAAISA